jgi:hypothetical protein
MKMEDLKGERERDGEANKKLEYLKIKPGLHRTEKTTCFRGKVFVPLRPLFNDRTMLRIRTTTLMLRNTSLTPIPFLKASSSKFHSHYPQRLTQSLKVYDVPQGPQLPIDSPTPSRIKRFLGKKFHDSKPYIKQHVEGIRPFEAKPKRALLYVPGSSQKMIDKAWTLDVDNIVYALHGRNVDYRLWI